VSMKGEVPWEGKGDSYIFGKPRERKCGNCGFISRAATQARGPFASKKKYHPEAK